MADVLTWCLSQHISVKKHFYKELRDLGPFYFKFVPSTGNLGLPRAKNLQNGGLSFLLSRRKIKPVTTRKMASHLIWMRTYSFRKNTYLTDPNHCKDPKMKILHTRFNTERNRYCLWWRATFRVLHFVHWRWLVIKILLFFSRKLCLPKMWTSPTILFTLTWVVHCSRCMVWHVQIVSLWPWLIWGLHEA